MWAFKDKGDRDVCLIPEVTGLIQELWRDQWSKERSTMKLFYSQRCYRYERPQKGRYREFTQFGVEFLGSKGPEDRQEVIELLRTCMDDCGVSWTLNDAVKRGLSYYTEDGFEAVCEQLGAQKQVAGGGRYAEGIGWAIGVDRLILAKEA
jgi:histidyl-tRNA synthetase